MPLYLDNNATTALDSRVLDAMLPYLQAIYGNPSSVHRYGRLTRDALELARHQVAGLVSAQPGQVIFTSGGTEANNLAIKGVLSAMEAGRFAVSAIEHSSLLEAAKSLQNIAWAMDVIGVTANGKVTEQLLWQAITEHTKLVSVMLANNETGVIQPVQSLCEVAHQSGALFHTDASQAAGKIQVDFTELGVDLMTLSSHKIYGPQGIGALIADRSIDIHPIMLGGGQERGKRSGTENIAGIVGFGKAAELAGTELEQRQTLTGQLRDELIRQLAAIKQVVLFATEEQRLPNTVQFAVKGFDGETLLMQLDKQGIAVSSGSACHAGSTEPSHVLMAMKVPEQIAKSAIRVSFGKDNKVDDIKQFLDALNKILT
ncbi:MAG: cysteine desulfurase [Gammaproteobacteria bacterium]|nr:cysteine desulfurase [Gammaproteobacteria bacterium]